MFLCNTKKNIALNCCKSFLKLLYIETINQLSFLPLELLKDKLKSSAKKKFDSSDTKKLVSSFKQFGKFKIQYLKKKYVYTGYYDCKNNTVYSSKNQYILSHEICHATSIFNLNKKCFTYVSKTAYLIFNNLIFISYLNSFLNTNHILNQYVRRYTAIASSGLSKLARTASVFVLAEEAQASIRAVSMVHKIFGKIQALEAAKLLSTAYGTYVWSALRGLVIIPAVCRWSYSGTAR